MLPFNKDELYDFIAEHSRHHGGFERSAQFVKLQTINHLIKTRFGGKAKLVSRHYEDDRSPHSVEITELEFLDNRLVAITETPVDGQFYIFGVGDYTNGIIYQKRVESETDSPNISQRNEGPRAACRPSMRGIVTFEESQRILIISTIIEIENMIAQATIERHPSAATLIGKNIDYITTVPSEDPFFYAAPAVKVADLSKEFDSGCGYTDTCILSVGSVRNGIYTKVRGDMIKSESEALSEAMNPDVKKSYRTAPSYANNEFLLGMKALT